MASPLSGTGLGHPLLGASQRGEPCHGAGGNMLYAVYALYALYVLYAVCVECLCRLCFMRVYVLCARVGCICCMSVYVLYARECVV